MMIRSWRIFCDKQCK